MPNIWLISEGDIISHAENPNTTQGTQLEGIILIDRGRIKQLKIYLLDTPKVRCIFRNMYKNLYKIGWSYSGTALYTNEYKVSLTCE